MKILIDGNDGVGKTTLAKRLINTFNIKSYIHLSNKDPRDYEFYSNVLRKNDVIFDRSFMDEKIYSKIFNRELKLDSNDELRLHRQVSEENVFVIICYSDENIFDNNEYEEVIKNKELVNKYFVDLANNKGYLLFNVRTDSYDNLVNTITEHFRKWKIM